MPGDFKYATQTHRKWIKRVVKCVFFLSRSLSKRSTPDSLFPTHTGTHTSTQPPSSHERMREKEMSAMLCELNHVMFFFLFFSLFHLLLLLKCSIVIAGTSDPHSTESCFLSPRRNLVCPIKTKTKRKIFDMYKMSSSKKDIYLQNFCIKKT